MTQTTMRNAFLSALDQLYDFAGDSDGQRAKQVIVKGPSGELLTARRDDFIVDDAGVEILDEFVMNWSGIAELDTHEGVMKINLSDGKFVDLEACP